ncbi:hypothetical protein F2Q69_00054089 [Brassica cretica]|uniref:Uncharacterized protein n=1 Tax=Brassica cretica TaxID=69181 RepID=A0A8S9MUI3_BRACR|nr:hypothetical protein F2Q69_00054089 [Brassica cretica]
MQLFFPWIRGEEIGQSDLHFSIVLIRVVEAYTALASPIKFPDRGGFFSSVVTVKSPERGGSYRSIAAGFCPLILVGGRWKLSGVKVDA